MDNRLYWVDAKLHVIGSSDFFGGKRRVVLSDIAHIKHPFAITVFEDWVYWTDWGTESINSYSKFGNGSTSSVTRGLHSPMGVRVYHELAQPSGKCLCALLPVSLVFEMYQFIRKSLSAVICLEAI